MPKSLMNHDLVERIVRSYEALIADTLQRPERGKFKHISILCLQVRDLLEWNVTTVSDADTAMEDAGAIPIRRGGAQRAERNRLNGPNQIGLIGNYPPMQLNDPVADTVRAVVGAMQPTVDVLVEKNRLKREDQRTDRLETLLDLRDRLKEAGRPTEAIDRQIDAALAALEEPEHADHDLVDTLVLRRSPAGTDAQRALPSHRREVDGAGDGGAGLAPGDGGEEEVAG